jgi:hypothetical protein
MKFLRDLYWIIPSSLVLGLMLSLPGPGTWWIGWLAYSILLILGLLALSALCRSVDTPKMLILMLTLAVMLRLGLGISFFYILPVYGNDNEANRAGYPVRDAYSYDGQAWKLAASGDPLWKAFDRSYKDANQYDDQYGGLLFTHSLVFRYLSGDAHRPWLLVLLSALAGALGVALAWKAAHKAWGEPVAWAAAWIMALYPEAVLVGGAQLREPFLITFAVMVFWGAVNWSDNWRTSAAWMAGGIAGMLLFHPGSAVAAIVITSVWIWIRERGGRRARWWWIAGGGAAALLAIILFIGAVGGSLKVHSGPLQTLVNWIHDSAAWDAYLLVQHSGWIQNVMSSLPESLHLPFIIGYGTSQPLLPAAIADPGVWPMRLLGILRGLGWYALLPFLVYSLRSIIKMTDRRERLAWLWLWLVTWAWIFLSAGRAGGDQWDNPRYRAILMFFQAALAAQAFTWQRASRDRWLWRILAVEGVFLALFGYWYISRKFDLGLSVPHIFTVLGAIAVISAAILVGGWLWDRRMVKKG